MVGFEATPPDLRPLLSQPISGLGLKLEGSPVERYVAQLYRELNAKGLRHFRPPCYLTDEWGCPSGEPIIGIPFYLADPNLARLEKAIDDLEDAREILMYLRHEAGHAFNYAYRGSKVSVPKLPEKVLAVMQQAAVTAFQALHLRDYARFDFRLMRDGTVYMLEANPNPYLHSGAEFMKAARASGRTHPGTIQEIVELAMTRYPTRV